MEIIEGERKVTRNVISILLFILLIILCDTSFANNMKVYVDNAQKGTAENEDLSEGEYSVDIYAETTEKAISGFQFKLLYPENMELIDIETGDIEQVSMNAYSKRVVGYRKDTSQLLTGKVKLCTLIFEIIEESKNDSYNVKIDFTNKYSKVIDVDGNKIHIQNDGETEKKPEGNTGTEEDKNNQEGNTGTEEDKNNQEGNTGIEEDKNNQGGNTGIEEDKNNQGGNTGTGENKNSSEKNTQTGENGTNQSGNIASNQLQRKDGNVFVKDNGVPENKEGGVSGVLPKTGTGFGVLLISILLIGNTVLLVIRFLQYKNEGV